jgi:hypothetical protein
MRMYITYMTAAKEEKERNFRLLISSYNDCHILYSIFNHYYHHHDYDYYFFCTSLPG